MTNFSSSLVSSPGFRRNTLSPSAKCGGRLILSYCFFRQDCAFLTIPSASSHASNILKYRRAPYSFNSTNDRVVGGLNTASVGNLGSRPYSRKNGVSWVLCCMVASKQTAHTRSSRPSLSLPPSLSWPT